MGKSLELVAIELIELAYDLLAQSSLDFSDSLEMLRDALQHIKDGLRKE